MLEESYFYDSASKYVATPWILEIWSFNTLTYWDNYT